jgi:hypothetical protein
MTKPTDKEKQYRERALVSKANAMARRGQPPAATLMINSIFFLDVIEIEQDRHGLWSIRTVTSGCSTIHTLFIDFMTLFEPDNSSVPIQWNGQDRTWEYCEHVNL